MLGHIKFAPQGIVHCVSMCLVSPEAKWTVDKLANFLTDGEVVVAIPGLLKPALRVKLAEGWIVPKFDDRAVELITSEEFTLEPGECLAMTLGA